VPRTGTYRFSGLGDDYLVVLVNGRPILPLFATAPFSEEEKSRLVSTFGSYQIEWDNIPVFPVR